MNDPIISKILFNSFVSLTGSERAIAVGVTPAYAYIDGKKTETIEGYHVECVLPKLAFTKIRVKVAKKPAFSASDLENAETATFVSFEDFSARIYSNADGAHLSSKAESCTIVDKEEFVESNY